MIDKNKLIDRVCSVCEYDKTQAEEDFDAVLGEICAMYGRQNVYISPDSEEVCDEYEGAILSGLLYIATGEPDKRRLYLDRAESAFRTVWRARAKKRKKAKV